MAFLDESKFRTAESTSILSCISGSSKLSPMLTCPWLPDDAPESEPVDPSADEDEEFGADWSELESCPPVWS